jgi:son of sevenless-like protein
MSGLYLSDITFIKQGNPDMLANNRLINFDKFGKMATIVEELQRFQEQKYALINILEIGELFKTQMGESRDVQELHDLSLSIEPREQVFNDDGEQSGMLSHMASKGFI